MLTRTDLRRSNQMLRLYITRHGKTVMNQKGLFQGSSDSQLNEIGIQTVEALQKTIDKIRFDEVYVSPLGRTLETYQRLKTELMGSAIVLDNLKEFDFGIMEYQPINEAKQKWPESFNSLYNDPENHIPVEGSETIKNFHQRIKLVLHDILLRHSSGNVLIITHGLVMRSMLMIFLNRTWSDFWIDGYIASSALLIVDYDGVEFKVISKFENIHLDKILDV